MYVDKCYDNIHMDLVNIDFGDLEAWGNFCRKYGVAEQMDTEFMTKAHDIVMALARPDLVEPWEKDNIFIWLNLQMAMLRLEYTTGNKVDITSPSYKGVVAYRIVKDMEAGRMFRECTNNRCGKWYSTLHAMKYCSPACGHAVASRMYRNRLKEREM